MESLKPCPWCEKKPEMVRQDYSGKKLWGLSCCEFFFDVRANSEAEAIKAWNTRRPESKTATGDEKPEVRQAREAVEYLLSVDERVIEQLWRDMPEKMDLLLTRLGAAIRESGRGTK